MDSRFFLGSKPHSRQRQQDQVTHPEDIPTERSGPALRMLRDQVHVVPLAQFRATLKPPPLLLSLSRFWGRDTSGLHCCKAADPIFPGSIGSPELGTNDSLQGVMRVSTKSAFISLQSRGDEMILQGHLFLQMPPGFGA